MICDEFAIYDFDGSATRIVRYVCRVSRVARSWLIKGKSYLRASVPTRVPLNKIDRKVADRAIIFDVEDL